MSTLGKLITRPSPVCGLSRGSSAQGSIKACSPDWSSLGFPGGASGKNKTKPTCQCRRCRFDSWVLKLPWRKVWQPLQYSCLENPMGRRTWCWAVVHRVTCLGLSITGVNLQNRSFQDQSKIQAVFYWQPLKKHMTHSEIQHLVDDYVRLSGKFNQ